MLIRTLLLLAILLPFAAGAAARTPAADKTADKAAGEKAAVEPPAAGTPAAGTPADRIVFTVTGFKNDKGRLRCALFPEDGWLDVSVLSTDAEIEGARAVCVFAGVPAGTYGISSYHDKNDNGKMDFGLMRIPKEDYAASNGAKGSFGPPKFADAKFTYEGGPLELSSEIR